MNTLLPGEPKKWCTCEGRHACLGCLIVQMVEEKFGQNGLEHLASFVPQAVMDEASAALVSGTGMSIGKAMMDMKMHT